MDFLLTQKLNDSVVRDPLASFMDKAVTELDSPKQQAMYAYLDSMDGDDDFNLDDIPPTKEESNSNKPTIKGLN